jgi:single-stranded DNA-binding protein
LARAARYAGPRQRWRGHLTAGKGTTDPQAATQAAGSPGISQGEAMNPISLTVTGRLGDDPRAFTTRDGTAGVELRLAVEIGGRDNQNITRWIKVVAFGLLAAHTAESVGKGDRVTVVADDLTAESWLSNSDHQPRARVTVRARDIAASMTFDDLRTGYAARKAARNAAASGQPNDLPAGEQADAEVLAGVTA